MEKKDWSELVDGICKQHIIPKLRRIRRKFLHFDCCDRFPFGENGLYRASRTIRYIDENFDDDADLSKVFKEEFLYETLDRLSSGVEDSNRLILDTGIADVVEEFYDEIVDGMEVSDIPEIDFRALREAGSNDPKSEILVTMVRMKKRRKAWLSYNNRDMDIKYTLKESSEIIIRRRKERDSVEAPTKRRIFKGLGGICRGAILTGVDVGLLAGVWPVPLSADTTTVGAVTSIVTGIGDIMIAVGDLRGE
ncbi:MAG TPA: hypothetical protein VI298_06100 [Geobacteraceae bacterium]